MEQIKIFHSLLWDRGPAEEIRDEIEDIHKKINEWLEKDDIEITRVAQSQSTSGDLNSYTSLVISIFYKNK